MRALIGAAALASGLALVVVPRYVLPACGWAGFPAMRCSVTARAEMVTGALLAVVGLAALLVRRQAATAAAGTVALALSVAAFVLPQRIGFCHASQMPCTYGMVPAVRFIAGLGGLVVIVGLANLGKGARRKGTA